MDSGRNEKLVPSGKKRKIIVRTEKTPKKVTSQQNY